jgi:hypothetical protein
MFGLLLVIVRELLSTLAREAGPLLSGTKKLRLHLNSFSRGAAWGQGNIAGSRHSGT